jgi:tRNA C32,U32 (ribose-2'-O)-methylase TrmJ
MHKRQGAKYRCLNLAHAVRVYVMWILNGASELRGTDHPERHKEMWNFMSAIRSLRFNLSSVSLHCAS